MPARRLARAVGLVLGSVAALGLLAAVGIHTPWFQEWARAQAERAGNRLLRGELTIGHLEGNLLKGVELADVAIRLDGRDVLVASHVSVGYSVGRLFEKDVVLDRVRLVAPLVTLVETDAGWNVASILEPARPGEEPAGRGIAIDILEVDGGRLVVERQKTAYAGAAARLPERIEQLSAELSLSYRAGDARLSVRRASFVSRNPALLVHDMSGSVGSRDRHVRFDELDVRTDRSRLQLDGFYDRRASPPYVSARLEASPVDFGEWAAFVPALASIGIAPNVDADAVGPLDALRVRASADDPRAGSVSIDLLLDADQPVRRAKGSVGARALDLAPVFGNGRFASAFTGTARIDLSTKAGALAADALEGHFDVSGRDLEIAGYRADRVEADGRIRRGHANLSARVDAYGATVTGRARVALDEQDVAYEASGRVAGLDLRRLPERLGAPELESGLSFHYRAAGANSQHQATLTLEPSTVEGASIMKGATVRFTQKGGRPRYGFAGTVSHLDIARLARALAFAPLDDPRLASDVNGAFALEGTGSRLSDLELQTRGQLAPSVVLGADLPSLAFDAAVADGRLRFAGRGAVRGLRLDRLDLDPTITGLVNAEFDVAGRYDALARTATLDAFEGQVKASLDRSEFRGIAIDRAYLVGSYAARLAQVEVLRVTGPALELSASGSVSLGDAHESDLAYRMEIFRLEELDALVGHSLAGTARIEGQVGGARDRLVVSGPLAVSRLRYGTLLDALSAKGTYSVALPDFDPARLSLDASLEAALLTVKGRDLTSASARVGYAKPTLTFDATLRSGKRTAVVRGRAAFEPDEQGIRIERIALGTDSTMWTNASGRAIDIAYRQGMAVLDDVQLSAGAQRLTLNGSLPLVGAEAGRLDVTVEDVELAAMSELLLAERQWSGRLSARATITGPPAARAARGDAVIQGGAIEQLSYESLVATVEYADEVAQVDITLVQTPGARLAITGAVPVASSGSALPSARGVELHVESTPISLSVVQAFTTQLEDVNGTIELNVDVSGTLAVPHLQGQVSVLDGAFTLAATGVRYRDLDARLTLDGVSATFDQLTVVDEDGHRMTVTALLGFDGRRIGAIDAQVKAADFHVLDNDVGTIAVLADLALRGSLQEPRLAGRVGIESGTVEVDVLLERFASNPYRTSPTTVATEQSGRGGLLANLEIDLTVAVPNNLLVRGSDIRGGAGVPLGDVNITVGGLLDVKKPRGGETAIIGTVNTVRGSYDFQGRRFAVQRDGQIEFRGDRPVDPALALAADREVSGVVARVEIGGTAREPELRLSSDPPMEETDILSLIVFNQPAGELGDAERASLSERAAALASAAIVGAIAEPLGRALNLSIFDVEMVSEAGGAPMVTVGKQVGSRLFVRLRQLFGAQEVSDLLLEYQLADLLRLQASVAEGKGLTNRSLTRRVERGGLDVVVVLEY